MNTKPLAFLLLASVLLSAGQEGRKSVPNRPVKPPAADRAEITKAKMMSLAKRSADMFNDLYMTPGEEEYDAKGVYEAVWYERPNFAISTAFGTKC